MSQTFTNEATEFIIGTAVVCDTAALGELRRVVVDPVAVAVTHLVVEARHRRGSGHLVPIALVSSAGADQIRLRCTESEFSKLEKAEEIELVPAVYGPWNYQYGQVMPYWGLSDGGMASGGIVGQHAVISDRIPSGDVELRHGDHVRAADGEVGRLQGLVVDAADHSVTHFLLQEGHLWGRKRVAIPITAVTGMDDGVVLRLTKRQLEELPAG